MVGVAHPVLGEDVVAVVALRPEEQATAEDLRAHTLERLAAYKVPRRVGIRRRTAPQRHRQGSQGQVARPTVGRRGGTGHRPGRDDPGPGDAGAGPPDPTHRLTLPGVLAEHRRSRPQTRSVVCGQVRLTYPEFDERTDRLANALADVGVGRGDRVVWLGQNCHRLIEAWLAGSKLGAVVVPADWARAPARW